MPTHIPVLHFLNMFVVKEREEKKSKEMRVDGREDRKDMKGDKRHSGKLKIGEKTKKVLKEQESR